jgi:hypothetical protein
MEGMGGLTLHEEGGSAVWLQPGIDQEKTKEKKYKCQNNPIYNEFFLGTSFADLAF